MIKRVKVINSQAEIPRAARALYILRLGGSAFGSVSAGTSQSFL